MNVIKWLIDPQFGSMLGLYGLSKIRKDSPFAYWIFKDDFLITNAKDEKQIDLASVKFNECIRGVKHQLVNLDAFLWFIRDNSCNIPNILAYTTAGKADNIADWDYKPIVTNCKGEFETVSYTLSEIEESIKIRTRFFELCPEYVEEDEAYIAKKDKKDKVISEEIVRDLNPIERAFTFLRSARNSKSLASKIASYMSLFESLLSMDDMEVTHKVSERTAFYLGANKTERLLIYNKVKEAYNIRSKYVHGSSSKQEFRAKSYRLDLLVHIDEYARKLLTKAIMVDSEKFLREDIMAKFLKELVFEDPKI